MDALTRVLVATLAVASTPALVSVGTVRTIAGTGEPGFTDGAAQAATFIAPVGVAVARDGTIAIADSGAQRVRLLANGYVKTAAGSGEMEKDWDFVAPLAGLGTATDAHFSGPAGLAYLPDGTLLIADSDNHCIRAYRDGKVTLFAGSLAAGLADGTRASATFSTPNAIAVDGDGNVFVADLQGPLREISGDAVTTIPLPEAAGPNAVGVATFGSGANERIFVSTYNGLVVYAPAHGAPRSPTFYGKLSEGNRSFGFPAALVALRGDAVAFSDAKDSTVRVFRLPVHEGDLPSVQPMPVEVVEDGAFAGAGYADGTLRAARFDVPQGLARAANGDFIVADTGNRRIRRIDGGAARLPFVPGKDALPAGKTWIVGGPPSFFDTLWPASIAGLISAEQPSSNAETLLYDDTMEAESSEAIARAANSKPLAIVWIATTRDLSTLGIPGNVERARTAVPGARFVIATLPLAGEISSRRDFSLLALQPNFDFAAAHTRYRTLQAVAQKGGVPTLDLSGAIGDEFALDDPYATLTPNLSEGGRVVVAHAIAVYLANHPQKLAPFSVR